MKKIRTLLFTALTLGACAGFTSCSDDDNDLPDVTFEVSIEGGVFDDDGDIYVVQGDVLNVTSVTVKNNEPNKGATIANLSYYLEGIYLGTTNLPPFSCRDITGPDTPVGDYDLDITCNVLAVDKEVAVAALDYDIEVVPDASYLPAGHTSAYIDKTSLKK